VGSEVGYAEVVFWGPKRYFISPLIVKIARFIALKVFCRLPVASRRLNSSPSFRRET